MTGVPLLTMTLSWPSTFLTTTMSGASTSTVCVSVSVTVPPSGAVPVAVPMLVVSTCRVAVHWNVQVSRASNTASWSPAVLTGSVRQTTPSGSLSSTMVTDVRGVPSPPSVTA